MKQIVSMASAFRKWGFVDALDLESEKDLRKLEEQMQKFYNNLAFDQDYWILSESKNEIWKSDTHPYHCHWLSLVEKESSVVDFGCGSAHAIYNLNNSSSRNVKYTGIELSKQQVQINISKYPDSKFIHGDIVEDHEIQMVDWAISMFAIEHCVRPHLLLERMYQSLKPGGKLAILCPNFVSGMPSIRSGIRATTKSSKLHKLQLLDLFYSYYQEKYILPSRVKHILQSSILFPIYLYPRCLEAPFYSDNDAVALVVESKVAQYLELLGLKILHSSSTLFPKSKNSDSNGILYLIAEKT
jgi:SAM-dependent methyltransferase